MRKHASWLTAGLTVAAAWLALTGASSDDVRQEQLLRWRSLGKAFYENPATQQEAVDAFRKALELAPDSAVDRLNYALALLRLGKVEEAIAELEKVQRQDPTIPHTWFNLGIQYKNLGQFDRALQQLEQMVRLVPDEPVSHYNLGVLYRLQGKLEEAVREFELAAKLDPSLAAPYFQLFNLYRQAGEQEKAREYLKVFQELKERQKQAVVPEDMNWSRYAEIYEPMEPGLPIVASGEVRLEPGALLRAKGPVALVAFRGDRQLSLVAARGSSLVVFDPTGKLLAAAETGVGTIRSLSPGDFDNDGVADLCVVGSAGAALIRVTARGLELAPVRLPPGDYNLAVWLDYDHDNDLDLFLLGKTSRLLRNAGQAGFEDRSASFPFEQGEIRGAAALPVQPDTKSMDLVVSYASRAGALFLDRLVERYERLSLPELPAGASDLQVADCNHDGWLDLLYRVGPSLQVALNQRGRWEVAVLGEATGAPVLADLENRGTQDVLAGSVCYRNSGLGRFERADLPGWNGQRALAAADLDGDGRVDLVAEEADAIRIFWNRTKNDYGWVGVSLEGRKALKSAAGAVVELKAGRLYQKKLYQGLPLEFGLDGRQQIDTIRITWPNGLVQNEIRPISNRLHHFAEQERISGSCPMVWTWNGKQFQFVGDVLGVAPLGVRSGENQFFPADHDEVLLIPEGALRAREGRYEVRITQELAEVAYVDEVKLIAVDAPGSIEVYTNQKFQPPPFPPLELYAVRRKYRPVRAWLDGTQDVLARLIRRDGQYVDSFPLGSRPGVARFHTLTLEFPPAVPADRVVLILHGWTDWADGSTYLGVAQESREGLQFPRLDLLGDDGTWQTVVPNTGVPSGSPRSIVVDLRGKLPGNRRVLRLVTNMCLYWDEIFLGELAPSVELRISEVRSQRAQLRFRGWSQIWRHPSGRLPQQFFYEPVTYEAPWNQTPGFYTRYGDVQELVEAVDDRFVILGTGDELQLQFPERELPPLPAGWRRTFLLAVDGWEKDQDANTMFSWSVEPLPFHGMSSYPYPPTERYPTGGFHQEYLRRYQTRPALRIHRQLAPR